MNATMIIRVFTSLLIFVNLLLVFGLHSIEEFDIIVRMKLCHFFQCCGCWTLVAFSSVKQSLMSIKDSVIVE